MTGREGGDIFSPHTLSYKEQSDNSRPALATPAIIHENIPTWLSVASSLPYLKGLNNTRV